MRKLLTLSILIFSLSCFAQKELSFSSTVNYAPNNYTTGNGFFTSSEKIESISQTPVLNFGIDYSKYISNSLSLSFGLEYSYVKANSNDYVLSTDDNSTSATVQSSDVAVRNYLSPNFSISWRPEIRGRSNLVLSLQTKFGLPFLSYDKVQFIPGIDPFYGFLSSVEHEKVNKYVGDEFGGEFSDGLLYGGEFSILYSFYSRKLSEIAVGPNINVLKLNSVDEVKMSVGIKLVYNYQVSES